MIFLQKMRLFSYHILHGACKNGARFALFKMFNQINSNFYNATLLVRGDVDLLMLFSHRTAPKNMLELNQGEKPIGMPRLECYWGKKQ